ncbi:MAG: 3'(2'),5'-bisphosphate nucleotidase CysQ [Halioglobus sp.]
MSELQSLVYQLLDICAEAGEAICRLYHSPEAGEYRSKGDESPLTQADLAAHRILQAGLEALPEQLPVLSEESGECEVADRQSWPRYWLVDPLDGTKEFLARTGQFTINVALIDAHRPVLGIVYLPLEQSAYAGVPGSSAQHYQRDGERWRGEAIATRSLQRNRPMVVLASRRHRGARLEECLDWLQQRWGELERRDSGSALKFCRLAAGEGDFYPRFARCCEWDTAAGQAVVEAAGGQVLGMDGKPLRYNLRDDLYSRPFYAVADPADAIWKQLLSR